MARIEMAHRETTVGIVHNAHVTAVQRQEGLQPRLFQFIENG